jgi:lipoate-protein ligase B
MKVENLGLIDYESAYKIQLEKVESVLAGNSEETLLICSHPSVVTLGKKSSESDIGSWDGKIINIERGGQATYHGPGQVIIYPIINLKNHGQNVAGFLEILEQCMIETLKSFDLDASGNPNRGQPDYTGVWVNGSKVASIGVAIKKWVTYHGLALNLYKDDKAFKGINPCGFSSSIMTSMEDILQKNDLSRENIELDLIKRLKESLLALK